ncbi:MAG: hypothetical protein SFU86_23835 [Pirellulaceae bacterium]|nr:hypothetical protein [Pirellulaceae bacterium]
MTLRILRLTTAMAAAWLAVGGSGPVAAAVPAPVEVKDARNPLEISPVPQVPLEVLPVSARGEIGPRKVLQATGVVPATLNPQFFRPVQRIATQIAPPAPPPQIPSPQIPMPAVPIAAAEPTQPAAPVKTAEPALPQPAETPPQPTETAPPKPLAPAAVLPAPDPQNPIPSDPLQPAEVLPAPNPQAEAARSQLLPDERSIRKLTIEIAPQAGVMPQNIAAERFDEKYDAYAFRPWEAQIYYWDAPDFCHRPLYFEQVNLERYGYTHCRALAPVVSGAHFITSTLALPYNMTVHPRRECMYPLGYYRPGSPVPYQYQWPEFQVKAVAVEAAVVTGLIFFIP